MPEPHFTPDAQPEAPVRPRCKGTCGDAECEQMERDFQAAKPEATAPVAESPAPATACPVQDRLKGAGSRTVISGCVVLSEPFFDSVVASPCPCEELRAELAAANERAKKVERGKAYMLANLRSLKDQFDNLLNIADADFESKKLAVIQRDTARQQLGEAVEALREIIALNGHLAITEHQRFLAGGHEKRIAALVARFDAQGGKI